MTNSLCYSMDVADDSVSILLSYIVFPGQEAYSIKEIVLATTSTDITT